MKATPPDDLEDLRRATARREYLRRIKQHRRAMRELERVLRERRWDELDEDER
jgi:hypothetical protein